MGGLHLPRGIAKRRVLERTETLEVEFDVESPGLLIVVAAAGEWGEPGQLLPRTRAGARVPHRVELLAPGAVVAAERTSDAPESFLVHEVVESDVATGSWTARVTNLATTIQEFGFFVSYPGTHDLLVADFSADVFSELAELSLELHRGHQASSLTIETSKGPVTHYFTLHDMDYSCPWMPRVVAYFENVRSTSTRVSVPAGTHDPLLRYELAFADDGIEINGTIPLDLRDMRLTVDLPIIVRYHKAAQSKTLATIAYEEDDVDVDFSFEPRFGELVEWFPGFFPRWRRQIQRTVEDACRELLASYELRKLFSDLMHARVLEQIGADSKPVGVAAADGKLRISYYTF
jgi:hypothetical protein